MKLRSPSRRSGAARQATALTALALSVGVPPPVRAQDAGGHAADEVLIRPDRVFDAEAGRTRDGWAVLVRGDRIADVGPVGELTAAPGAEVIELPGTTLLPGFIEAHAHLFLHPYSETLWDDQVLKEARAYRTVRAAVHARQNLLSGFTTLRDLGTEGAGCAPCGRTRSAGPCGSRRGAGPT
jgi:imidazolonepropionase-like amidohydrolase